MSEEVLVLRVEPLDEGPDRVGDRVHLRRGGIGDAVHVLGAGPRGQGERESEKDYHRSRAHEVPRYESSPGTMPRQPRKLHPPHPPGTRITLPRVSRASSRRCASAAWSKG